MTKKTKQVKIEQEAGLVPGPEFKVTRIPMPRVTAKPKAKENQSSHLKFWFVILVLVVLFLQAVATISTLQKHYDSLDKNHWQLIEAINKNPQNYENIN